MTNNGDLYIWGRNKGNLLGIGKSRKIIKEPLRVRVISFTKSIVPPGRAPFIALIAALSEVVHHKRVNEYDIHSSTRESVYLVFALKTPEEQKILGSVQRGTILHSA